MTNPTAELIDDAQLMQRIAERDVEAFRMFYRRHSSAAMALCVRVLGNRADAEEVLADVFFELWEKSANYDPSKAAPATYLMILARSRAIDQLRRRGRGPVLRPLGTGPEHTLHPAETACSPGPGPADSFQSEELRALVRGVLSQLDSKRREAMELAYYEGLTHREIAERLEMPLGTVKSNIRTAMTLLRNALRQHYDHPED